MAVPAGGWDASDSEIGLHHEDDAVLDNLVIQAMQITQVNTSDYK